MLTLPSSVRVYVASGPVDLRKSFDGLSALVRQTEGHDPASGYLYVFFNRRGDQVRCLFWDRTGYCILAKRLAQGRFRFVHQVVEGANYVEMEAAELALVLEGIDLSDASRRKRFRRVQAA